MALATISAGRLTRVVTLKEPTFADDVAGQPVITYADSTTITPAARRARVRMLTGRELEESDSVVSQTDFEVTFRHIPDSMPARQTLIASTNFAADDTVTLDTAIYTFKAAPSANGEIDVGTDLETSLDNLRAAINLEVPISGKYGAATLLHTTVTAVLSTATTLIVAAKSYGTGGNSIASERGGGNTGNGGWVSTTLGGGATTGGRLTTDYRLSLDDGDTLEIASVVNQERQSMTVCRCTRTTDG